MFRVRISKWRRYCQEFYEELLWNNRKERETLPLEGGGKRVGVKGLTGIAKRLRKYSTDTEQHLWRHLRDKQIEGFKFRRQTIRNTLLTPHPAPLPQGERGDYF